MGIPENIKMLREKYKLTQDDLGKIAGVSGKAVHTWEAGLREPRMGAIQKIADHFRISKSSIIEDGGLNHLTPHASVPQMQNQPDIVKGQNATDQWQPTLTKKDQRDIAKEVENILDGLDNRTALSFDGEAIDDTTKELLKKSLENTLETARLVAKEKYTPNKYRK